MDWEEFVDEYKPEINTFDDNASIDGYMFETYGEEAQYLKMKEERNIWTVIDGDDNNLYLIPGCHFVNRLGYIITEKKWEDESIEILI